MSRRPRDPRPGDLTGGMGSRTLARHKGGDALFPKDRDMSRTNGELKTSENDDRVFASRVGVVLGILCGAPIGLSMKGF